MKHLVSIMKTTMALMLVYFSTAHRELKQDKHTHTQKKTEEKLATQR